MGCASQQRSGIRRSFLYDTSHVASYIGFALLEPLPLLQLSKELRNGHVFDGWKEGMINFGPTYKYEINSDVYVGQNPKEGEKKRSPAW